MEKENRVHIFFLLFVGNFEYDVNLADLCMRSYFIDECKHFSGTYFPCFARKSNPLYLFENMKKFNKLRRLCKNKFGNMFAQLITQISSLYNLI